LSKDQSRTLTISYIPADSGYTYTKFEFETDVCPSKYYVSGGWPGKRSTIRTIKLLKPNGGEVFLAGSEIEVKWEGISPDEPVTIEYRTDDSSPWVKLTDTAKGLSYKFTAPKIASNKYLARVTAKTNYTEYYEEVQICDQIWMKKNLDVVTYRNGDTIPQVSDATEWENLTTGAWCYYNNDPKNGEIYGKLYNWYAVNDPRGLAPEGWRIPTDEEWKELEMCLGMSQSEADDIGWRGTDEGSKLAGNAGLWHDGVLENNTNFGTSGFSGLPGGYRNNRGSFNYVGCIAYWWSSSEYSTSDVWSRSLYYSNSVVYRDGANKKTGVSVRCVRD
jgi:uncharacterized protein (TIGR02145 family)